MPVKTARCSTSTHPDHTRLRRLVSKAFTPRVIEELRPRVQELVDEALDKMEVGGGGDVVDSLAFPLPFDVISEMLGMPEADKIRIRDWSSAVVKTLDPIVSDDDLRVAIQASVNLRKHTQVGHRMEARQSWRRLAHSINRRGGGRRPTNNR